MEKKCRNICGRFGIEIRRACCQDINELIAITREAYKDSLKWHSRRAMAKKWWGLFLDSRCCETWVCLCNENIEGFVVLILDVDQYNEQKRKQRPSLGDVLFMSMTHPVLLIRKIFGRIFSRNAMIIGQPTVQNSEGSATDTLWVELMAVLPNMRRKGLATTMLRFCSQRATELCRNTIKLCVDKKNAGARRLYEKLGFFMTTNTKYSCIYTKALTQ